MSGVPPQILMESHNSRVNLKEINPVRPQLRKSNAKSFEKTSISQNFFVQKGADQAKTYRKFKKRTRIMPKTRIVFRNTRTTKPKSAIRIQPHALFSVGNKGGTQVPEEITMGGGGKHTG
jgi:hypothetical protein